MAAVVIITAMGGTVRQYQGQSAEAGTQPPPPGSSAAPTAAAETDFPTEISVEPGTTFSELLVLVDRAGVDVDEFVTLVHEPEWAGLAGTGWEADTLERMLFPGDYVIDTPNPQPLISEMIDRLQVAVDADLQAAAAERRLTPAELIDRAAAVQAATDITAEMPALAELAANTRPPPVSVAPTVDAIRAVLWPTAFRSDPDSGPGTQLILSHPDAQTESAPSIVSADDLERLLTRQPGERTGRISYAIGRSSTIHAGVGINDLYETGGLEAMAVTYAAETLIAVGDLDETDSVRIPLDLMGRELPAAREALRTADIRKVIDLAIDEGNRTAVAALIEAIGVDRLEATLRSAGVDSTSLRSRPMVITAGDVVRLAQLLDQRSVTGGLTLLDRFFARQTDSWMDGDFVSRNGITSFVVEEPELFHEVARLLEDDQELILVHLSEAGPAARASASHAAHATSLYAMHYERDFGTDDTACTFPSRRSGALDGVTVGLDPGHGGKDLGAVHVLDDGSELLESSVNTAIATELKDRLVAVGADVVMTRCEDESVTLGARAYILNRGSVDLAVSIHANDFDDDRINRSTVIKYSNRDLGLARTIAGDDSSGLQAVLVGTNSISEVTVDTDSGAVLVMSIPPTVLVEPVSMSHPAEAADLQAALAGLSDRVDVIAGGLADGIRIAVANGPGR